MKFKNLSHLMIILSCANTFSQEKEVKITGVTITNPNQTDTTKVRIDSSFLLLGIINDYNGYNYGNLENKFDSFYLSETPLINYVDSIVKTDFDVILKKDKNNFTSKEMFQLMNSFYVKNKLNDSLFSNIEKKLSFLLGVYFRNGEKISDNIYKIQLANSPKHKNVYQMLLELNCQNIYYKRLDSYPRIYQIYFQPTEIMKKYFATIETEKNKLTASSDQFSRSNQKMRETYKITKEKENLKIIELFSKK